MVVTKQELGVLNLDSIKFGFEVFLEEHEENLPEGLDPQYLTYVSHIEKPIANFKKLPQALATLPMNAVLHQKWSVIVRLIGLIILLASPTLVLIIQTAILQGKSAIGYVLVFFILFGVIISPVYLKALYMILNSMIESKKNTWLLETIEKPFATAYHTQWNKKYLKISFIIPILLDMELIIFNLLDGPGITRFNPVITILWLIALIIGHFGISLMLYISILSYRYVTLNSKIYDHLLIKITERIKGYTDGHESILSKKNYEVVGVLSDTPGLSIRSLGDIPIFGLAASTVIFNAILFIITGPVFLKIQFNVSIRGDDTGLTLILIIGLVLSMIAAFGAVIVPIVRVSRVIAKFKNKALTELDPFLFDEITSVALKRDSIISNETQVLYMLRNYIYIMKPSPVNPIRLIQIALLVTVYVFRGVPVIVQLLNIFG